VTKPCSALPHRAGGMAFGADAGSGVFGVRAQIRRAFVAPCGCCATKLRSDPKNPTARCFVKCFRPLAQAKRAQAAMKIVATTRPESDPIPQNPCECAEERKTRRIRARDCLSAASSSGTPAGLSTGRCPQRSGGTQAPGSPFFGLPYFSEAKKGESPAAATERHRNSSKNLVLESGQGFRHAPQEVNK
jgi:hypothetical protein